MFKKLLLAAALVLASSSAWAQNTQCSDRPSADSSNACANTRFVHGVVNSNFANPTALVGLTPVNGVATTAMRSDAAPALSQAITPTWAGLHIFTATTGGISLVGNPSISQAFSGQTNLVGQNIQLTAASATQAETAGLDVITSSTGATPNALIAYKAARQGSATCNSGSGYCWGQNYVVNIGAGGSKRGGIVDETNLNNNWGPYTGSPGIPYAANYVATGTNAGGYSSFAFGAEFGGVGTMWQAGLHFGPLGFNPFNTAAIWDESNSPTILKAAGSHINGIDIASASFSGNAYMSAGFVVTAAGDLGSNSVNAAGTNQSTSPTTGAIITAGGLGVAKDIFGGGKVDVVAASGYYLGGVQQFWQAGNYTILADNQGSVYLQPGNTVDPSNYYNNTNHVYRNRAGSVTYATINANGVQSNGYLGCAPPVTKTGTSGTIAASDCSVIFNASGTYTATLPAPATYPGRILYVKSIAAQIVNSASSNVVPRTTAVAGTAILASGAGNWAQLQSDGTNWIVMSGN